MVGHKSPPEAAMESNRRRPVQNGHKTLWRSGHGPDSAEFGPDNGSESRAICMSRSPCIPKSPAENARGSLLGRMKPSPPKRAGESGRIRDELNRVSRRSNPHGRTILATTNTARSTGCVCVLFLSLLVSAKSNSVRLYKFQWRLGVGDCEPGALGGETVIEKEDLVGLARGEGQDIGRVGGCKCGAVGQCVSGGDIDLDGAAGA